MAISEAELTALFEEIKLAEALNEQELLPQMREAIERYTGRHVPSIAVDWTIILNEVYPIVAFGLPSSFFRTPHAFVKPRHKNFIAKRRNPRTGKMEEVQMDSLKSARTQEGLINYHLDEIKYKREIRKVNLDAHLFKHAVLWHGYKGSFGMTEEQSLFIQNERLWVQRVSPLRFLKSPNVPLNELENARWTGRSFDVPLPDVLEDDKFTIEQDKIKGQVGFGDLVGSKDAMDFLRGGGSRAEASRKYKPLLDRATAAFKESKFARFVTLYEIFMRPTKAQRRKGSKGTMLLLTFEQFKPLRENEWPYKAEGWPGKILMYNEVPEQHFGMSDLDVYSPIADHKNLVINQQIRNAEKTNKVWVGIAKDGMSDEEEVEKIRAGQSTVVFFDSDDARKRMFVASAAGAGSNELYLLDGRIDQNLQDKSGVSDMKRGTPPKSGEESAASVRERARGGGARPAYRQDQMGDFLNESVGFLLDLMKQYVPLRQAVRIIGSTDIEWTDEFTEGEIQADVDVEVDIQSMLPESPETELRNITQILGLMLDALQTPQILQKLQQENKTFNISPVIETMLHRLRIRDPEVFREIKPEESQGFASVAELRTAQQNVVASITGQPLPDPPKEGQDHKTRLEVYGSVAQLLQALGEVSDQLNELITQQNELLAQEQAKADAEALKNKPRNRLAAATNGAVQVAK